MRKRISFWHTASYKMLLAPSAVVQQLGLGVFVVSGGGACFAHALGFPLALVSELVCSSGMNEPWTRGDGVDSVWCASPCGVGQNRADAEKRVERRCCTFLVY